MDDKYHLKKKLGLTSVEDFRTAGGSHAEASFCTESLPKE